MLLVPGLLAPAWTWAPVARRLARVRRTAVADLRGHGLSDSPPDGYDLDTLAEDAALVAEAAGLVEAGWVATRRFVVAGHGFGACVAAALAAAAGRAVRGPACSSTAASSVSRRRPGSTSTSSCAVSTSRRRCCARCHAWLADRRAFDPATWDDDQQRAAIDAVVETAAGHVVRAVRPHVVEALVRTMFAYDPAPLLAGVAAPGDGARRPGRRRPRPAPRGAAPGRRMRGPSRAAARSGSPGSRTPRTTCRATGRRRLRRPSSAPRADGARPTRARPGAPLR